MAGCVIGIDPGERWIGVARAAAGSSAALPVGTIDLRSSADGGRSELRGLIGDDPVAVLVAGVPVRPDGAMDEQAARFRALGERLADALGAEFAGQEERGTSQGGELPPPRAAGGKARRAGARSTKRMKRERERSHAAAAARILQRWLDERPAREVDALRARRLHAGDAG